jgi:hypothetical protein
MPGNASGNILGRSILGSWISRSGSDGRPIFGSSGKVMRGIVAVGLAATGTAIGRENGTMLLLALAGKFGTRAIGGAMVADAGI